MAGGDCDSSSRSFAGVVDHESPSSNRCCETGELSRSDGPLQTEEKSQTAVEGEDRGSADDFNDRQLNYAVR